MIAPVVLLGAGAFSFGAWAWWGLGAMILLGSKIIWIATEVIWGKYRQ
ncbi:MAG: hypothetical protein ACE5DS_10500 [Kiloniellaceae bacterium]